MELIDREKSEIDVNMLSPLTWAYVGDAVYELYIRTNLVNNTKLKPHKLHIESIKYVKAKAQADILKKLENDLTEEEEMQKITISLKTQTQRITCILQHSKH